jgi:hypothetical protein
MPRVKQVKARQDYPQFGVKKGDIHYTWAFFRQGIQRSLTRPKPSQLCNPKLSSAYEAMETLEDAIPEATTPDDLVAALQEAIGGVQSSIEEYDETVSNLEDAWPGGCPALEEATEKRDNLQTCVDDLETAVSEIEAMDVEEFITPESYADASQGQKKPESFDDLNEDDQASFMEAAREKAGEVSLDA